MALFCVAFRRFSVYLLRFPFRSYIQIWFEISWVCHLKERYSYNNYYYSGELFTPALAGVFHWNLSNSKAPQVTKTLLRILADLNNAAVGIVSRLLLISISSSLFSYLLGTVPSAPTTFGITVIFRFPSFSARVFAFFFILLYFRSVVSWKPIPRNDKFFFSS